MQICEVAEPLIETKIVWAKKGKDNIRKKYISMIIESLNKV